MNCKTCNGFIPEPLKTYGLAVKFCLCGRLEKKQSFPHLEILSPCGCVGPQNCQPLCPCQMRGVSIKDGRYQRVQDLGPIA